MLFRSAALIYGPRTIGVVLSGALDDGTAGLQAIKARGGVTVVQDPHDALFTGMPVSAIETVAVDHVLPAADIAALITRLVEAEVAGRNPGRRPTLLVREVAMSEMDPVLVADEAHCPDCGGVLWQQPDEPHLRFRCRVGHAYGAESLLAAQSQGIEDALWMALRALEEKADMAQRLLERARTMNQTLVIPRYAEQAREADGAADTLRRLLVQGQTPVLEAAAVAAQ